MGLLLTNQYGILYLEVINMIEKVLETNISKEKSYLYFIDKDGDISRAIAKRGGLKQKSIIKKCHGCGKDFPFKKSNLVYCYKCRRNKKKAYREGNKIRIKKYYHDWYVKNGRKRPNGKTTIPRGGGVAHT